MKIFVFAFAILMAGASAVPSDVETKINERFVEGIVADIIADVSQNIHDAGFDPLNIPYSSENYRLPVTNLVNVDVLVEQLASTGLSNIVIHRVSYGILTSRLILEIGLPRIFIGAGTTEVDAQLMGWSFKAGVSGSLSIVNPRVHADVRINLGIISGISIRSITINFTLGGVESNLRVNVQGTDYSDAINNFASTTVPNALAANRAEINELLEYIVIQIADELL